MERQLASAPADGAQAGSREMDGPVESGGRVFEGLRVIIERESRLTRSTAVSTASVEPFYARLSNLQHPNEDEFVQV